MLALMTQHTAMLVTTPAGDRVATSIVIGFDVAICTSLFVAAYLRLRRRLSFTINAEDFIFTVWPVMGETRITRWPRRSILGARQESHTGKLVLRIQGQDPLTIYTSPGPQAADAVAQAISQALQHQFLATLPGAAAPARPRSRRCIAGVCLTTAFLIAGIVILIWGGQWACFGMLALPLAVITAGVSLGTQDKEFWA
jgi:hypothetical protein